MSIPIIWIWQKFQKNIQTERLQWFLWVPVLYAGGILLYFSLRFEPDIQWGIVAAASLLIGSIILRKRKFVCGLLLTVFFIMAGFVGANVRALLVNGPVLQASSRVFTVEGRIDTLDTYKKGRRIILDNLKINKLSPQMTPNRIRFTMLTNLGDATIGDVIKIRVALQAPQKSVVPGGYDFGRDAYFKQIGGVGFAVGPATIIASGNHLSPELEQNTSFITKFWRQSGYNFWEQVSQIRQNIATRFMDAVGGQEAQIAKALFVGDTGGIDNKTMIAIRNSGLAHLLSISGLHLALVCFIFFTMTRYLLALMPVIALNFNTKKIAAFLAISGSYFYLLLSGNQVAAERAFIMAGMALLAILVNRSSQPMRLVAIAALFILVMAPENILLPGFQMSFAAVIGLIAGFNWLAPHLSQFADAWKIPKIIMNLFGTVISSVIATLVTAPYGIYHFNRSSPYGIIANLLAIPLTSILVMPLGVLAVLLMPLHLEWLVAWPLKVTIEWVVQIAKYVAAMPYAASTVVAVNDWQLLLLSLGFLWLALWQNTWRLAGVIMVVIAVGASLFNNTPDIIISDDAVVFAVKDENGKLLFSSKRPRKMIRESWLATMGQEEVASIDDGGDNVIECESAGCIYKMNGYVVAFIRQKEGLADYCAGANVVINLTKTHYNCVTAVKQIDFTDLQHKGAHEIYLGSRVAVKTVVSGYQRIWESKISEVGNVQTEY